MLLSMYGNLVVSVLPINNLPSATGKMVPCLASSLCNNVSYSSSASNAFVFTGFGSFCSGFIIGAFGFFSRFFRFPGQMVLFSKYSSICESSFWCVSGMKQQMNIVARTDIMAKNHWTRAQPPKKSTMSQKNWTEMNMAMCAPPMTIPWPMLKIFKIDLIRK